MNCCERMICDQEYEFPMFRDDSEDGGDGIVLVADGKAILLNLEFCPFCGKSLAA